MADTSGSLDEKNAIKRTRRVPSASLVPPRGFAADSLEQEEWVALPDVYFPLLQLLSRCHGNPFNVGTIQVSEHLLSKGITARVGKKR